jgi:hypothetical protein
VTLMKRHGNQFWRVSFSNQYFLVDSSLVSHPLCPNFLVYYFFISPLRLLAKIVLNSKTTSGPLTFAATNASEVQIGTVTSPGHHFS